MRNNLKKFPGAGYSSSRPRPRPALEIFDDYSLFNNKYL
jgi:hypothetical protein